ncbi:MAG TPA: helix-turn-helix domain-containing protein [Xanthobacteraceae bacterium]|nr:helix-turn-helix domain-containing protein [Xanthobacteraceae bacterium]
MSIETQLAAKEPKRARGKLRVAALLDAGAALFAEKGYEATTMTEIAQRSGAAIGSLYQFFPSKDALAEALFNRYAERTATALQHVVDRAPGLSSAPLADLLVDYKLALRSDRDAVVDFSSSIAAVVERRKPLRDAVRREIAAILRSANDGLTDEQATAAAVMIGEIMKTVPMLAKAEEDSRLPLIIQARTALALYIERVLDAGAVRRRGGRS